jgi:hypothetical protein
MANLCHTAYGNVNKKMPCVFAKISNLCKPQIMPKDIETAPIHPKAQEIIDNIREELRKIAGRIGQPTLADRCHMDQGHLSKILKMGNYILDSLIQNFFAFSHFSS